MGSPAFTTFPRPLKAVVLGVPALGVALAAVAAAIGGFGAGQPWRWFLIPTCLAGVVLAERYPVKIGPEQKVNLGALPCLVAALLLPPGIGPATAGLSVLVGNRIVRRTWAESVLNSEAPTLSSPQRSERRQRRRCISRSTSASASFPPRYMVAGRTSPCSGRRSSPRGRPS